MTAHRRVAGSPLSPFAPGVPGWPAAPVAPGAPAGPRLPSTCRPLIARLALRSARLAIRSVEASFVARLAALVAWGAPKAGASMEAQSSAATVMSTMKVVRRERRIWRRYTDTASGRKRQLRSAHALLQPFQRGRQVRGRLIGPPDDERGREGCLRAGALDALARSFGD